MSAILDGLDDQQRAAASHVEGPALIIAGAGAGKTTTLVRRIAHLINQGVDPASILTLSFTRASAASILDRARHFEPLAREVVGGTFHSIGNRVLRDYHSVFGLDRDFTLLDPADAEALIKDAVMVNPTTTARPQVPTMAKIISFARNTCQSIEETVSTRYAKHAAEIDYIVKIAETYKNAKAQFNLLDYDDLLELWALLCEHERAGLALQRRFQHIIIDEYQDSNNIQLRILYALGGEGNEAGRSVVAVGDPSQSIFAFRGAAPGTMFDFQRRWPSTQVYLIETNYRSTPEIVAAADRIDRSMVERFDRKLLSRRHSLNLKPRIRQVADADEEAQYIAETVLDKMRDEGVPYHEQAVIVRSMRAARRVELSFKEMRIPYKVVGGVKIHEAAHIKDVLATLKIAVNPRDAVSLGRLLESFPKIGPATAKKIAMEVASENLAGIIAGLTDIALKRTQLAPLVRALSAVDLAAPAASVRASKQALASTMAAKWPDDWTSREKDIDIIADLAESFPDAGQFLETITLDVAIDKKAEAGGGYDDERPVTISTIHGAKGLEWQVVFLPNFVHGQLPSAFAETPEEIDEERRLFYVAVTRAKDELIFVRPSLTLARGEWMPVGSSPFEATVKDLVDREAYTRPERVAPPSMPSDIHIDPWS